jgi:predicted nucleic acid-binding protein
MIFVDTVYLLAVAKPRDEFHARALKWAASVSAPLLTTDYVLWEMVNCLSKAIDRPKAHALLSDIEELHDWEIVASSDALFRSGLEIHRQHADKEWSLTDCISFIVMRERAVQRALTHDHHFEQAGFEALLRRDP